MKRPEGRAPFALKGQFDRRTIPFLFLALAAIFGALPLARAQAPNSTLSSTPSPTPAPTQATRPNIILLIADDMAWDDCGAYGNASIRTPNIDRLGREGMRFDRAFLTCSSCSPSRASLITGRYPHNTDAEQLHWPLPRDRVTFVEKLKQAGYWTAAAGKWHLGDEVKDRFDRVVEVGSAGFQ